MPSFCIYLLGWYKDGFASPSSSLHWSTCYTAEVNISLFMSLLSIFVLFLSTHEVPQCCHTSLLWYIFSMLLPVQLGTSDSSSLAWSLLFHPNCFEQVKGRTMQRCLCSGSFLCPILLASSSKQSEEKQ